MKTQKNKFGKTLSLMFSVFMMGMFTLSSCSSDDNGNNDERGVVTYTLQLENAGVQDAKCGIDLANGNVYSVSEGASQQEDIDIAYGYMYRNDRYERCFLAMSYAGCWCGGSSYFSYGDRIDGYGQGYSSYSVLNDTKIAMVTGAVDFDGLFSSGTKNDLEAVFATEDPNYTDEAQFSTNDNLAQYPYVFFETVKGKKGIIRIKGYVKNTETDYQLMSNPIMIDVVVEK